MDFSRYPQSVQELGNQVLKTRYTDRKRVLEYCEKMIELGNESGDSYLLGFAYYYKAECYFINNDYYNFVEALTVSIEHQQKSSQWMLLTRSYNLLGVNAYTQGNINLALDHYLEALKYCEEHRFEYEKAMLMTNIGHIYMAQKNYSRALECFTKGRELFERQTGANFAKNNIILIDIAMGRAYLTLGDLESAIERERLAGVNEALITEDDESVMAMMCFHAKLSHYRGDIQESNQYISRVIDTLEECVSILDIHDDIMEFAIFLLKTDRLEEFISTAQKIDVIIDKMGITKLKIEMLRLWAQYYKQIEDRVKYLETCAKLYELYIVYEEESASVFQSTIQLRFKLEEAKQSQERLMQEKQVLIKKSETDPLTGLANRYKLGDYLEQMFEKAYEEQKSLGVGMVDIDFFKQYNDTYGHLAGDEAIQALAGVLRETSEAEDVFCARYGGDEFVLVFYNKTDAEILEIASQIKERVKELKLKHEKSTISPYVTISQGFRNTVPVKENKIWDYYFSADTALYKMKNRGRNGIFLVHQMAAESSDTIMITDTTSNEK